MEHMTLRERYAGLAKELVKYSHASGKIDASNVYQEANPDTRKFMDMLVQDNLLPNSRIEGREHFESFFDQVCAGKRGLILMEHYANTDLPALCYLLEHDGSPKLAELSKRIVAIAGMKLNEDNPVVRAFAESFSRVVIYPTRSLDKNEKNAQSEEEAKAEEQKARKINLAAMRAMAECKKRGQVILVFPSGTRYRPDKPETKRGLREIDSYLRMFDIVILVSVNGNILLIHNENMIEDWVNPDVQIFASSPVIECESFRAEYLASLPQDEADPKQKMIDHIMELLEAQHDTYEKLRQSN